MQTIRIAFVDFWDGFHFEKYLSYFMPEYTPVIDTENPEIIFYSCFGTEHLKYERGIRVFINRESYMPDFNDCDYTIGTIQLDFDHRVLYLPAYYPMGGVSGLTKQYHPINRENALQRDFCSFIYSQDYHGEGAKLRKDFCAKLMQRYKYVACPGKVLHNCDPVELAPAWPAIPLRANADIAPSSSSSLHTRTWIYQGILPRNW